jgi:hypothetical protein
MSHLISLYSDIDDIVDPYIVLRMFRGFVVLEELSFFKRTVVFLFIKKLVRIQDLKLSFFGVGLLRLIVAFPNEYETHKKDHEIFVS